MSTTRRQALPPGVRPSRARIVDLGREAGAGISQRLVRSVLTMLGTVLGVGAFVTTLGLTATANAQIGASFDVLKATEVRLEDTTPTPDLGLPFPDDTDQRLQALNGVRAAGRYWTLTTSQAPTAQPALTETTDQPVPVIAASPGAVTATQPSVKTGRLYDTWHQNNQARVAIVGRAAARQLGVTRISQTPAVFIDGIPFAVIGILDDVKRNPDLLLSIVIPDTTALHYWGQSAITGPTRALIDVQPGAAQLIGRQAAHAVHPQAPERLQTLVPPEPKTLRQNVERDSSTLYLALAAVTLLIGAVGIANTTLVSVLERTPEIGLRRALGATRGHIATQFLTESTTLGTLGGITGTILALVATTIIAITRQWTPTISTTTLTIAPILGTLTGLAAGIYPALKATTIQPLHALRTA